MTASSNRRLTAQEVERITQPLYERSLLELKEEWQRRFAAKQPPTAPLIATAERESARRDFEMLRERHGLTKSQPLQKSAK
jgi:hypothetical protein